jgi:polyhydroxyalkanoate synthesis regulator phasin
MNYVSITGITLGIAVVAVLAIGLLSYMSQLVKNAYQIKVEIRSDMEEGLRKIEEEMGKKTKWMRSEVGEDVAKMRQGIEQDNGHRLEGIEDRLTTLAQDLDRDSREERSELRNTVNQLRKKVVSMEQEITALKEEMARRAALGQKRRDDAPAPSAKEATPERSEAKPPEAPRPSPVPQTAQMPQEAPAPEVEANTRNTVVRTPGGVQRMELQNFGGNKA